MELQKVDRLSLLPKRPRGNYSCKFKTVKVTTNHFKVKFQSFQRIHIFSVTYTPQIPLDNVILRRKLLEQNKNKIKAFIENPVISGNNIYSTYLPKSENFQVETTEFKIHFKKVKEMNLKENPKLLLSFLNNAFRSLMRNLNYIEIGRSGKYFNTNDKTNIDNLMMFGGYRSNFVLLQNGYFLRVDSTKKIVRNQTVLQFIDQTYIIHKDKEREEKRNILQSELSGKIVMTNYGKTAYYRIEEVVFQEIDSVIFDDGQTTLRSYYEKKYNLKIINKRQPLLKVQNRSRNKEFLTYLIPEFCLMTGIPENFDEFRRKKISENTIKSADEKQREILKLMKQLKANPDFCSLKDMGININKDLETVNGKIIPMPRLNLGENHAVEQGKEAFFNLFNKPIFSNHHNIKCAIIYFTGQDVKLLLDTFESTSRNLKAKFEAVKMNLGDYDSRRSIDQIEVTIEKAVMQNCNICLIVLNNQLKGQYKKIKKSALVKNKIVSQIVTQITLRKKNLQSIATKILLQIIAKRGNTLWVPKTSANLGTAMMVAFDSAKVGRKTNMALCATLNSTFSSIFSRTESYENIESKFNVMMNLTLKAVDAYYRRNKEVPEEVIIFPSSTSNDQIVMFQQYFVKPMKSKLQQVYKNKFVAITLLMINLKTCERFFTPGENNIKNVPAGTLISTEIVSNFYDFYVVSQTSNKGSIVPNHYKVISSDSKLEEGILQELVFSQCFNYVNWTGSIKVPGIVQYAGKCAKFISQILQGEALSDEIQNKPYYI